MNIIDKHSLTFTTENFLKVTVFYEPMSCVVMEIDTSLNNAFLTWPIKQ